MRRVLRPGERPERPQLRNWFDTRREAWLVLEPHRIGLLAGALCATLLLAVQLLRQLNGAMVPLPRVILWALLTFVISYGAVGIFVWYLLAIANRELPAVEREERHVRSLRGDRTEAAREEDVS